MEAKGQAPARLSPPGPSAVGGGGGQHCTTLQTIKNVASQDAAGSQTPAGQISFYVTGLLLVTLHNNNLPA